MSFDQVYVTPFGKEIHVGTIYEHAWGDTRLSRLLIDWEVETNWMCGRRTADEIKRTAEGFPVWFVRQLERTGSLDSGATVRVTIKEKSRAIEGGHKVSFHFIINIAGNPRVRKSSL